VVEELLPAFVARVAEVDVDEGVALRLYRFLDESEAGLLGGSAALFHVAARASANHIRPGWFAAHASGDNVVEGQLAGWEAPATILAFVFVACVDVSAIELYLVTREAVVEEQAYDSGDGDVEIYGRDPVVAIRLEIAFEFADLAPGVEIVVGICALLEGDDLGKLAAEQRESAPCADNADSHIMLVQDKDITIEAGFRF